MHIVSNNNNQSLQFTSKNKMVRDLGDISMLVRREFPVVSSTFLECKNIRGSAIQKFYFYASSLIEEMRGFSKTKSGYNIIKLMNSIKRLRAGNCSEMANTTYIACKLNGYKDAKRVSLCAYNKTTKKLRELDHSIVAINCDTPSDIKAINLSSPIYSKTKSVIVDSWLGKVGFEREMTSEYKHGKLGKSLKPDEVICYITHENGYELSKKDMIFIENNYPKLLKKGKPGLISRLVYRFMSKEKYEFEPIPMSVKEAHRRNTHLNNAMGNEEFTDLITKEISDRANKKNKKRTFLQKLRDEFKSPESMC